MMIKMGSDKGELTRDKRWDLITSEIWEGEKEEEEE